MTRKQLLNLKQVWSEFVPKIVEKTKVMHHLHSHKVFFTVQERRKGSAYLLEMSRVASEHHQRNKE